MSGEATVLCSENFVATSKLDAPIMQIFNMTRYSRVFYALPLLGHRNIVVLSHRSDLLHPYSNTQMANAARVLLSASATFRSIRKFSSERKQ